MKSLTKSRSNAKHSMALALIAASGLLVGSAGAAVIQITVNNESDTPITSPNWNVVDSLTTNFTDLIDSTGASTGVSLTQTNPFVGFNFSGTTTPQPPASDSFPGDTTHYNFYGDDTTPTATWTFSGLDSSTTMTFTFMASRMGATDNREAKYQLVGATTEEAFLDAADNDSQVAEITVQPDGTGTVVLNVTKGPNNDNGSGYFYLGAMTINTVPEASSLLLLVMSGAGFCLRRRRS